MIHSNCIQDTTEYITTDFSIQTNKLMKNSNYYLLSIGSLNTHDIGNNTRYINEIGMQTNILFISETQSTSKLNVANIIYNDIKNVLKKRIYNKKKVVVVVVAVD
jgi:hypothetical protein